MRARAFTAALCIAALAAGCGAPPPTEQPAAPAQREPAAPPAPAPRAAAPKLPPPKTPLDAYKREVAQRILDTNGEHTFAGPPPHLLRAVVVLQLTIDRTGKVTQLKTLRTRDGTMAKAASSSVRAAAPLPAPPAALLRRGTLEVAETWLFRDDGKFQVRSLAEGQPSPAD
jgi:protein TonB